MSRPLGSRYRIGASIGRGGMGEVFLGEDDIGEIYAIKVLHPELARDPEMVTRFVYERNALLRLRGPHVVAVHDLVIEGDDLAIVMELVPGGDLRQLVRRGPFPPSEAARVGAGIASALADAHAAGIVHGDVKPENVLLDDRHAPPRPRLADFGISRPQAGVAPELIGSPRYLAPERWQGSAPSAAADLYALGILLYELCCGLPPYIGEPAALREAHLGFSPGRPPGIPDSLWAAIADLTARDPAHRPGAAGQVAARLEGLALLTAATPPAPPLSAPPPPIRWASGAPAVSPTDETTMVVAPVALPAALPWEAAAAAAAAEAPHQPWAPRSDGRRRALIAGAAVIALLAGVGAVWAVNGGGDDPDTRDEAVPQIPVITTSSPTPSALPTPTPTPSASGTPTPTPTVSATQVPACEPFRPAPDGGFAGQVRRADAANRCRVDVRMMQTVLGVSPADGFFGERTERAIRKYQWERCPSYPNRGAIDRWTWDSVIRGRTASCPSTGQPSPSPSPTPAVTSTPTPTPTSTSTPTPTPTPTVTSTATP